MFTSISIVFRESIEIALVIVPLLIYINKIGNTNLLKGIYSGIIIGVLGSSTIGYVLFKTVGNIEGQAAITFEGLIKIAISLLILYSIVWLGSKKTKSISNPEYSNNIKPTVISLFILSFITVFRECLEILLFLFPIMYKGQFYIIIGSLIGLLGTLTISFIMYKTTIKINIDILFSITALILIFVGCEFFGSGLANLVSNNSKSMELAGMLAYGIPSLVIYTRSILKKYVNKNFK